jgi:hypothetical protein
VSGGCDLPGLAKVSGGGGGGGGEVFSLLCFQSRLIWGVPA